MTYAASGAIVECKKASLGNCSRDGRVDRDFLITKGVLQKRHVAISSSAAGNLRGRTPQIAAAPAANHHGAAPPDHDLCTAGSGTGALINSLVQQQKSPDIAVRAR